MATFKGTTQLTLWQVHQHITKETLETDLTAAGQIDLQNPGDSDSFPAPKNRLNNVRIDEITEKIFTMMNNEKVYQEPDLTLQMLADKIKIPPYQVSLAINEGMQKTFYELVNGHRVEEAKRLLLDSKNKNYTILSVGFEAGFNSKTTFNTVFKKFTGLTPTEYREKQKETSA
jgi:YesN/AraC family two-component response regulator